MAIHTHQTESTMNQKPTKLERSLTGKDDELALLIPVGQNLQAIRHDGQKLDIVPLEQGHHLLQAARQPHGHLGALLVPGLEKTVFFCFFFGFFWVFRFLGFFGVFLVLFYIAQNREFLGFFSFKNTFRCIQTLNYNHSY